MANQVNGILSTFYAIKYFYFLSFTQFTVCSYTLSDFFPLTIYISVPFLLSNYPFSVSLSLPSLIAFTKGIYTFIHTQCNLTLHTSVDVYVRYIQRWSAREIRELVVIDGWDKMMNGDCNTGEKERRKNAQGKKKKFTMLREEKKLHTCIQGREKNFKQGFINLSVVVMIVLA